MHLCPEKGTDGNLQQKNETNKTKKHLPEYSKIPLLSLFVYITVYISNWSREWWSTGLSGRGIWTV